jgi:hypothetical protein
MEVFLQNLPPDLTDRALQKQLTQFLEVLGILDWTCQKPRKKPFGNITFLHPKDGERFLAIYSGRNRLVIFGSQVKCSPSRRGKPDPFLLRNLTKSADDRHRAKQWAWRSIGSLTS